MVWGFITVLNICQGPFQFDNDDIIQYHDLPYNVSTSAGIEKTFRYLCSRSFTEDEMNENCIKILSEEMFCFMDGKAQLDFESFKH